MLTLRELIALQKLHAHERVLSAYFTPAPHDDRAHQGWRTALGVEVRRSGGAIAADGERRAFARARATLEHALAGEHRALHAPGVAAFVTEHGAVLLESLLFEVPPTAVWGRGMAVAPYMRALKEERPVLLAVTNTRTALLFRYQLGELKPLDRVHITGSPDDLAAATVRSLGQHADPDAWILIGGRMEVAARVTAMIPDALRARTGAALGVSVESSETDLSREARAAASRLRTASDLRALAELAAKPGSRTATMGTDDTLRRLDEMRVRQLFVSSHFIQEHASVAERAVRAALGQAADIEIVSGDAETRLDTLGGIAARLRYPTQQREASRPAARPRR